MGFVQLKYRIRHYIKPLFYFFVVIFLIGGAFSFSSYQRSHEMATTSAKRRVPGTVAKVNGQSIRRDSLDYQIYRMTHEGGGLPVDMRRPLVTQWLDSAIDNVLMEQAERQEKIHVSRKELEQKRMQAVEEALAPQIQERVALAKRLEKEGLTLEQYKQKIAHEHFGDLELFRSQIAEEKLQKAVEDRVKAPTDQELKDSYWEAKGRHILIDPKDLKAKAQAALDREKAKLGDQLAAAKKAGKTVDPAIQKRLDAISVERAGLDKRNWDDEAKKKAEDLRKQLLAGADFAKLARENSSDPGSGFNGGELGSFRRGRMVAEFDKVAFSIPVGQVSEPVKTRFGYHLIKIEKRELKLPKDFEKNKTTLLTQYQQEQKYRAWQEYRNQLKETAKIEIADPEIQAYRLLDEGGDQQKAISLLDLAIQQDPQNAGAMWELAQLWREQGNTDQALKLLQQAEKVPGAERSGELMYAIGELLEKKKQTAPAIEYYTKAADLTAPVEPQNEWMHRRLETKFKQLGKTALAKQETDWLARWKKAQAEQGGPGGMFGPGGNFTVQ
jgi:parvulin-like peptidyl-prolyl isomerase